MSKYLLSIISEQALPTLHFIKQFGEPDSFFLFVSTVEMEKNNATHHIIEALKLPTKQCRTIIIDANDAAQAKDNLIKAELPKDGKYLINLTGGNKLMSQMVFQHLQSYDSAMYYAPIQSDRYQQLYPEINQVQKSLKIVISLDEYLEAYGFELVRNEAVMIHKSSPKKLFEQVLKAGHPGKVRLITTATDQDYKEDDKNYLMGTWFEWYLYDHFRQTLQLPASQIAFNVGIKRKDNLGSMDKDNEFDILFIYKNDLYVFECKVYPTSKLKSDRISQPLFKLSSLTQNFGLKCKKYFAYLGEFTEDEQALDRLENIRHNLGVERILDIEIFRHSTGTDLLKANMDDKLQLLIQKFQKT
jgi:hypothetical protein